MTEKTSVLDSVPAVRDAIADGKVSTYASQRAFDPAREAHRATLLAPTPDELAAPHGPRKPAIFCGICRPAAVARTPRETVASAIDDGVEKSTALTAWVKSITRS